MIYTYLLQFFWRNYEIYQDGNCCCGAKYFDSGPCDGVEWSGFGSLYYSQAFDNNFLVGQARNNKPDFTTHSLLGLNVGSKISDQFQVATQIIMAGNQAQATNFNMFAQWAYLTYKPMDTVAIKLGRQLWPVLISSEYQRVHYLLPQSNIPNTTYGLLPFVSFDGASANKTFDVGIGTLTAGAYMGNPKLNNGGITGADLDFQTLMGARVTLDGSGWRLHATANRVFSKVTINNTSVSPGGVGINTTGSAKTNSDIYSLGYKVDKAGFVSWGEATYIKAKDDQNLTLTTRVTANGSLAAAPTTKKLFEKSYGGYVLVGYRFGAFLPTLTYSQGTTYLGLPAASNNAEYEGKTESYIAGLNYQAHDQVSMKVEYLRSYVPSINGGWYDVVQSTSSKKKHGDAVKAGVDFIF